jgi:hypothetical protein
VLDVLADRLDNSRALVPEHDREGHPVAVQRLNRQVGVANAAVLDLNPNLIGRGWIN